jgi:CMP-N-acetylneuraminic acid synthetase
MNQSKKCADIFKNVVISKDNEKIRMYGHKNNNKFFRDKRLRNELIMNISKLKLVLGMRSITGMIYIRALLDKINFVKKLFTYEIEDDAEVFIPVDLS